MAQILLVGSEEQTRAWRSMVERAGYAASVSFDAQGASAILKDRAVQAIVCSWMVLGDDGAGLIRRVRATVRPCPPIVLVGHSDSTEAQTAAQRAGADDYLHEPVDADRLLRCLEQCLTRYQRAHGLQSTPPPAVAYASPRGHSHPSKQTARLGSQRIGLSSSSVCPVVVGIVAGRDGTGALDFLFSQLASPVLRQASFVVICHDHSWFLHDRCQRLAVQLNTVVRWAEHDAPLAPGSVDIGVVGRAEVRIAGKPFRIQLARGIESEGIFPSADCLFGSMGKECGPGAIGVVLAGRGDDGAVGAKSLLKAGGTCLVQSPGSGYPEQMTQATMRHAPSSRQIPLEKLGDTLCRYIGELSRQLSRSQDGSVA